MQIEKSVMEKIRSEKVSIKPRWHFIAGSIFMAAGLASLSAGAIFLTNLTLFLIRKRGPGYGRLAMIFDNFPWWIPVVAVLGIALGIWLLRKYDISYKKNFLAIIIAFIASIIIFAWVMDKLGLNETWSKRGPMRGFYQRFDNQQIPTFRNHRMRNW